MHQLTSQRIETKDGDKDGQGNKSRLHTEIFAGLGGDGSQIIATEVADLLFGKKAGLQVQVCHHSPLYHT